MRYWTPWVGGWVGGWDVPKRDEEEVVPFEGDAIVALEDEHCLFGCVCVCVCGLATLYI